MVNIFNNIKASIVQSTEKSEGIKFSDIRPSKIVYFMAYAFELMLFNARGQFLTMGASIGGVSGWTIASAVHAIASLVFMILWSKKFKNLIYVSIAIMVAGFLPFIFLPLGITRLIFGIVFYIGLGGAVTAARCGYAFAANNAERFLGIIIMFFTVAVFRLVRSFGADGVVVTYVIPLALLGTLCICLFMFKEDDFEVKEKAVKSDEKGLYWAFAFFALYFAVDGYNASLTTGYLNPDFVFFFVGMVIAGLVLFLTVAKLKINIWNTWNIFFVASICMGLFATFAPQLETEKPQYFFSGLSMIGWPLCIYTLGCAQRHFASYALLKKCTVLYVVFSPIISLSSDLVESFAPKALPIVSMLFILFFAVAFLMASPFSYKYLFSAVWISDIYKTDMKLIKEKVEEADRFEKYGLTPRQKEIATLLLSAKTGRQIAGELGLSESTVKMHTSDLYRKLGINSKVELFRLFGVNSREESTVTK